MEVSPQEFRTLKRIRFHRVPKEGKKVQSGDEETGGKKKQTVLSPCLGKLFVCWGIKREQGGERKKVSKDFTQQKRGEKKRRPLKNSLANGNVNKKERRRAKRLTKRQVVGEKGGREDFCRVCKAEEGREGSVTDIRGTGGNIDGGRRERLNGGGAEKVFSKSER